MQQLILNLGEINKGRESNKSLVFGADANFSTQSRIQGMKFTGWIFESNIFSRCRVKTRNCKRKGVVCYIVTTRMSFYS